MPQFGALTTIYLWIDSIALRVIWILEIYQFIWIIFRSCWMRGLTPTFLTVETSLPSTSCTPTTTIRSSSCFPSSASPHRPSSEPPATKTWRASGRINFRETWSTTWRCTPSLRPPLKSSKTNIDRRSIDSNWLLWPLVSCEATKKLFKFITVDSCLIHLVI